MWKLHKALYRYKKAPKLWHQHVVTILENRNFHSHLTDPSCFRNDDLDINIFIHVDDGLLLGPDIELQRLIEHLSRQIMMRIVGKLVQQNDQVFFLGSVIKRTARGYRLKRTQSTFGMSLLFLVWKKQNQWRLRVSRGRRRQNHLLRWKMRDEQCTEQPWGNCCTCAKKRANIMYSVKETARKNHLSDRE